MRSNSAHVTQREWHLTAKVITEQFRAESTSRMFTSHTNMRHNELNYRPLGKEIQPFHQHVTFHSHVYFINSQLASANSELIKKDITVDHTNFFPPEVRILEWPYHIWFKTLKEKLPMSNVDIFVENKRSSLWRLNSLFIWQAIIMILKICCSKDTPINENLVLSIGLVTDILPPPPPPPPNLFGTNSCIE